MSRSFYLVVMISMLSIIATTNVQANAPSALPQMALMFGSYDKQTGSKNYISVFEKQSLVEQKRITINNYYWVASWSPSAKELVYLDEIADKDYVVLRKRAIGTETLAEYTNLAFFVDMDLSHNGRILYFDTDMKGYPKIDYMLKIMDVDGTTKTLYRAVDGDYTIGYISSAKWSPDGNYIALYGAPENELGEGSIFILATDCIKAPPCIPEELEIKDGSGKRLPGRNGYPAQPGEKWTTPIWSPDGKRLAFDCNENLCLLNRDGTRFVRFNTHEGLALNSDWSPDGQYLATECYYGHDICIFDLHTGQKINITNTPDIEEYDPVWLTWPDAEFLVEQQ